MGAYFTCCGEPSHAVIRTAPDDAGNAGARWVTSLRHRRVAAVASTLALTVYPVALVPIPWALSQPRPDRSSGV